MDSVGRGFPSHGSPYCSDGSNAKVGVEQLNVLAFCAPQLELQPAEAFKTRPDLGSADGEIC